MRFLKLNTTTGTLTTGQVHVSYASNATSPPADVRTTAYTTTKGMDPFVRNVTLAGRFRNEVAACQYALRSLCSDNRTRRSLIRALARSIVDADRETRRVDQRDRP